MPTEPTEDEIERQIRRYAKPFRTNIRRFASRSMVFAQLQFSSPIMMVVLAAGSGDARERREAVYKIECKYPLAEAMAALGLPYCLRRLPPEALQDVPDWIPLDPLYQGLIEQSVPRKPDEAVEWVRWQRRARASDNLQLAVCVARLKFLADRNASLVNPEPLVIYANAVTVPDLRRTYDLRTERNGRIDYLGAINQLRALSSAVETRCNLEGTGIRYPWLADGEARGYRFACVRNRLQLETVGSALGNCLRRSDSGYDRRIATDECRLFSIHAGKAGSCIALAEIRLMPNHDQGLPQLVQIRGPVNRSVPHDVALATYAWIGQQTTLDLPRPGTRRRWAPPTATWQSIWQPYWDQFGPSVLLPVEPDDQTIARFIGTLESLRALAETV